MLIFRYQFIQNINTSFNSNGKPCKSYQFQCLSFGLTSAPRVFSKILKSVVGAFRHMGIRLVIYLDDILVMHQSMEQLTQLTPLICYLFEALGLVINLMKSRLSPQQTLEFLGFQVDTVNLQLIFPAEKLRKIQQLAQHLLYQSRVSVRDLARFVGKTSVATRAIWQTPLHFRALQFLMNSVAPEGHSVASEEASNCEKFSTNLTLTKEARNNLNWWCAFDRMLTMQSPLQPRIPTMTLESDASNTGWGA